jgi:hypothetical protein
VRNDGRRGRRTTGSILLAACLSLVGLIPDRAFPQDGDSDLAKKLANPISSMISLPFQHNYDCCFGPEDAFRYSMNFQPVVPFKLNENWTLVIRTIIPTIYQEAPVGVLDDEFGLGDTTQSFFFVPPTTASGITVGFGPVLLWPTATEPSLGTEKWGAGPTGVILRQQGGLTYGVLANHIWSFAGENDRADVSNTFVQPFINYTWPNTVGITLNTEAVYDWENDQWTVPINLAVSKIFKFGTQPVSLSAGGRVYVERPEGGPEWGLRATATFLFPS